MQDLEAECLSAVQGTTADVAAAAQSYIAAFQKAQAQSNQLLAGYTTLATHSLVSDNDHYLGREVSRIRGVQDLF